MKLIVESSYESMSETAARILLGTMYQDKRVNISLTVGASPKGTYEILIDKFKEKPDDFSNVHVYNFDNADKAGYPNGLLVHELTEMFLKPAGVKSENAHFLTTQNYNQYDSEIENVGGLDVMLFGLGADGHFCANMPYAADLLGKTYSLIIKPEYPWYKATAKLYEGDKVPECFVTMGAASLMKVKHLVLIVNGESKADALKTFIESDIDNSFPASVLKLHPNFTVVTDEAAARLIRA